MDVDEARGDEAVGRVDLATADGTQTAIGGVDDLDDAVTDDAHVGDARRGARAVDDGAVPDDDVVVHAASYELG